MNTATVIPVWGIFTMVLIALAVVVLLGVIYLAFGFWNTDQAGHVERISWETEQKRKRNFTSHFSI